LACDWFKKKLSIVIRAVFTNFKDQMNEQRKLHDEVFGCQKKITAKLILKNKGEVIENQNTKRTINFALPLYNSV